MPRTKHYHVGSGLPGCLFDNNNVYETRRQADDGLRWERDSLIDCYEEEEGFRKFGSVKEGLIVVEFGRYGAQRYAERYECTDPECLEEDY
jgi:hypothetical protein